MRKLAALVAIAFPLAALAAPQPPGPPGAPDAEARRERMQKRMRLARTLGLAEALDLNEAEALKLRETLAKVDARREPVVMQAREAMEQVRKAAQGDAAAQKGLDDALKRLRDARGQMQALRDETFQAVTKDLAPDRKARAALFLMRFQKRMGGVGPMREGREGHFRGPHGPGGGRGPGPRFGAVDGQPEPPLAGLIEIEADDDELL